MPFLYCIKICCPATDDALGCEFVGGQWPDKFVQFSP